MRQCARRTRDAGIGRQMGRLVSAPKIPKGFRPAPGFCKSSGTRNSQARCAGTGKCPFADRAADAFASIMREAAAGLPEEKIRRPVEQILYHIGRWVYITDAWDDLEDDLKSGSYNAIVARFAVTTADGLAEAKEAVRLTLLQSAQTAAAASELLDLGRSDPVIKNILYMGLPAMAESVMEGTTKQRSSRHGSI